MPPKSKRNDPLEDAIVSDETVAADPFPSPPKEAAATAPPEEPRAIAVPPKPNAKQYKVVEDVRIAWHKGQFISLHKGDVVNESLYGTGAIKVLTEAGVKLEEV